MPRKIKNLSKGNNVKEKLENDLGLAKSELDNATQDLTKLYKCTKSR